MDTNTGNSGTPTPTHTLFDITTAPELARDQIVSLAAGTASALQVKEFFTPQECAAIIERLEHCELGSYDEQVVVPRIMKLGPAAFDYYLGGSLAAEYWDHAKQSNETRGTLLDGSDPLDAALDRIGKAWGSAVEPARVDGQALFSGMIREINQGARIHFDEIVREFPGVMDEEPLVQLAFNCHLAMPDSGGEAVVYRRRWTPGDEDHRDGYGYAPSLMEDYPVSSVRPSVGDAVFFDPRNYHKVEPNQGDGRRVTLSFFVGINANGRLIAWS
ncbi:2OG-Fe(II) oxygenase [Haloglycomyces albus]|uniref:2OG-Fe(II)-dependent halogenase WelO5 family protein n=1 Tax=Haloglycomyces albus TaxID=526067 RepID=UPI00046C97F7|nr:2OG-Fe(II) oxygenase [Haloglycomyces albus]